MPNYAAIKHIAKEVGLKVTDLLALTPQNDPFYVGTPTDIAMAQWFADVWQRAGYTTGVHLRRVHYWCVIHGQLKNHRGETYENTDRDWKYLTQAAKVARYLGYVRIRDISDNKNPPPAVSTFYSFDDELTYRIQVPDLDNPEINLFGLSVPDVQPYHCEVWVEKSTMNDVLAPLCQRYGANLLTFEGEVSITSCYDLIQRIKTAKSKPTRIFYISDFDPAGNSMPVAMSRKVEFMLKRFDCNIDVKVKPVALTLDQVRQYRLPRTPIKKSERRAAKFESEFGSGAVELDALEALQPGTLATLVENELQTYYSQKAAAEMYKMHDALRRQLVDQVEEITSMYTEEIAALAEMQSKLRAVSVDTSEYELERYQPHVDESSDWLFDSHRKYVEQIEFYKDHKRGDS